ncbi:putative swr1-complex protein 4 [Diaporthe ampelina]|uniref:SWR1-complex protein 4 n=1 Tax=Diaporthe ampelina TaxID=1214573 RepID=A0A0G2F6A3_9PEZI|nr:putative swr1-complex protein 4 [Diaporthe ampelina]
MASNDVRDVLNLPSDDITPRPSKKQKIAAPRHNLKGLAREVQNLGGDNPIAIVPEVSLYKKRRFANRKPAAKWELKEFRNSARADQSLILRHWKRKTEPGQPSDPADGEPSERANNENGEDNRTEDAIEDSAFAKFNVKVQIPEYNNEQYSAKLQNDDWTQEETSYLMELAKDYDLRWPVIWDRYDFVPKVRENTDMNGSDSAVVPTVKPRDMEDLKARYYEVAAKMMELQKAIQYMTQPEWDLHQTMVNFKPEQERERKKFALNSMSRSKEEAKEEESLLIEVKRIMARQERFNEERKELYQRLEYPHSDQDINAFKGSAGLTNLLGTLQNMSQAKKRKPLTGPEGAGPAVPAPGPNGQPASATSEAPPSRRESTAAPSAGVRESIGAEKPTPAGNKKGQPPTERRKLNEQEEQIYGVSTHERLGSGPTFRYERVNKIFSHKSGQQQQRIQNVLTELDIPVRLNMPTASVVAEYEKLVLAVTGLVDLRKMRDKLDGEIKIEEAKKNERAKARAVLGLDGASEDATLDKKADAGPAETKAEAVSEEKPPKTNGESATTAPDASADAQQTADTPVANGDGAAAAGDEASTPVVKEEEGGRPGSSGGGAPGNKRSASVLSTTSDKSAKRQKK